MHAISTASVGATVTTWEMVRVQETSEEVATEERMAHMSEE